MELTAGQLFSQLLNGIVLGAVYALIALGLSVIFGMVGVVNLAHGSLFAFGAYFALEAKKALGLGPTWILAPALVGVLGMILEVTMLKRVYGKEPLLGFMLTFGLSLVFEELVRMAWGTMGLPFDLPPALSTGVSLFGFQYSAYRLTVLVATALLVLGLWFFLERTRYGTIIRAGSRDAEMVSMLGINMSRIFTGVFGIGCVLAGAAGALAAPMWGVQPAMGASALMPSFVVVTIGGLGSYWGAVIAGILVGVAYGLTVTFYPPMAETTMYILMAVVLLLRPRGLLGEKWERFE